MPSMNGTIKRLVNDKGFGFILGGDGFEYFFHNSACQQTAFDDLREGQTVAAEGISIPVWGRITSDARPVRRSCGMDARSPSSLSRFLSALLTRPYLPLVASSRRRMPVL